MQAWIKSVGRAVTLAAVGAAVCAGPALADGTKKGSLKDAPVAPPPSDWTISYNFAVTTDYVFRGFSQSDQSPAIQGGVDVTYRIFYVGAWASTIELEPVGAFESNVEVDIYAGIKPVWGPITFDLGVIYYAYPGASSLPNADLDYVELKFGASGSPWRDATAGITVFYSPEYTGETGNVWTFEGTFAQALPKFRDIVPTISATLGYQLGDDAAYIAAVGNGDDNYLYWNAGISLAFSERFSVDFRYWDTNISSTGNFCEGASLQCDERFVATVKVTY